MSRTPMEPTYEPDAFYPSRDVETLSELLEILRSSQSSVASALAVTAPNITRDELREPERLDELLAALGSLRTELDAYTRIVAAYAMRDQHYTLLEAATRLNTGKSTLSRWRLHPVALDERYRPEARLPHAPRSVD